MGSFRNSIWYAIGILGTGIVFAIAIPIGILSMWFFPDLLNLPEVELQMKIVMSAIFGGFFILSIVMIIVGVRHNRKQKSPTDSSKKSDEFQ